MPYKDREARNQYQRDYASKRKRVRKKRVETGARTNPTCTSELSGHGPSGARTALQWSDGPHCVTMALGPALRYDGPGARAALRWIWVLFWHAAFGPSKIGSQLITQPQPVLYHSCGPSEFGSQPTPQSSPTLYYSSGPSKIGSQSIIQPQPSTIRADLDLDT